MLADNNLLSVFNPYHTLMVAYTCMHKWPLLTHPITCPSLCIIDFQTTSTTCAILPIPIVVCIYVAKKTGCLRSYCLKISCWCNLLLVKFNRQK